MKGRRIPAGTMRVALVFYGITRSLKLTLGSIQRNLVKPSMALASEVRTFGHFYDQTTIENPRSKESGSLDPEEYRLLDLDEVQIESPGTCLDRYSFETLKANGDPWRDGWASLRNLVHQLNSLGRASEMALEFRPHVVVFARPDLYYHEPITAHLELLAGIRRQRILVPDWASWHGFNDRFAIAKGDDVIRAFGLRVGRLGEYCSLGRKPHAERFLSFALQGQPVRPVPMRASRVRSNGLVVVEDFTRGRGIGGEEPLVPFADFERSLKTIATTAPSEAMSHRSSAPLLEGRS